MFHETTSLAHRAWVGVCSFLLLLSALAPATASAQEIELLNRKEPEAGVLFGGQPDPIHLSQLADEGYKTVIDLRREVEPRGFDEAARAKEFGLVYENLEIGADSLQDPATFEQFFNLFENAERPVLVHCASGNRVGAMYYAWLVQRKGKSREAALSTAKENGLTSEALVDVVNTWLDR